MRSIMLSIAVVAVSMSCMLGAVVYTTIDSGEATARPAQTRPVPNKVVRPQLWAAAETSVAHARIARTQALVWGCAQHVACSRDD